MTTLSLVILAGLLVAAGVVAVVVALVPSTPQLGGALDRLGLDDRPAPPAVDVGALSTRSERAGAWIYRHAPVPLSSNQQRLLRLQDKSVAEFYADKLVMMLVGALVPAAFAAAGLLFGGSLSPLPVVASLAGAVLGFFVPDLLLRRSTAVARDQAVRSLLLFIDLVTLERLANASSTQALRQAASLSDTPVFRQIRGALERAGLEQKAPFAELRRLAEQLDLPELVDIADVMQLDESGAALSGTLRARVKELRDAHLTREQTAASAAVEGMTLYMTLPAIIFGLLFMAAAVLRVMGADAP